MKTKKTSIQVLSCGLALLSAAMLPNLSVAQMSDEMSNSTMSAAGDTRAANAQMLIRTLSEEKTEINTLAGQQARLKQLGGRENMRLAAMWGRWINDHKAGSPTLIRLIRRNGGDPNAARILKAPVLGTQEKMLNATHLDHENAVKTSQMRYMATNDRRIRAAMNKRANLARKHLRQMAPYHREHHEMMQNGTHNGSMGNM